MKLGLLTDIHEDTTSLRRALDQLQREQVDQIVVIGDLLEMGHHVEETCRLLADAQTIGVWGNHDFGACHPDEELRERYSPETLDFLTSLQPTLTLENCCFSHIEPWLNPQDHADLWYFYGMPQTQAELDRIFQAGDFSVCFCGHYHRWLLASPTQVIDWDAGTPVNLSEDRYFVVVGALCEGQFAAYDTQSGWLKPFQLT